MLHTVLYRGEWSSISSVPQVKKQGCKTFTNSRYSVWENCGPDFQRRYYLTEPQLLVFTLFSLNDLLFRLLYQSLIYSPNCRIWCTEQNLWWGGWLHCAFLGLGTFRARRRCKVFGKKDGIFGTWSWQTNIYLLLKDCVNVIFFFCIFWKTVCWFWNASFFFSNTTLGYKQ